MPPTVSVIIPVFNRPAAVRRAIESVLAQTCQDFEIIVVDDASTDDTAASVAALPDRRITLIRHDHKRGGGAARNTGIRAAGAAYVAFLDSDDEWLPRKLERQLEIFRQSGDALGLVYSGCERILSDATVWKEIPEARGDLARRLLCANEVGGASVGMVRRQVLDEVGGFDEALPSAQDVDLWLRICEAFPADFAPEVLVRVWQRDEDRITQNVASLNRGRDLFWQKHRQKLMRHGVAHLWLRESGWVHHRYAGDPRMARSFYVRSIRLRPFVPFSYVMLMAAYLPLSWLDRMARCKHLLTGLLAKDPENRAADAGSRRAATPTLQPKRTTDSASL
jgi:glycosyltransferase involved in cell wall biosynthesis